MSNKDPPRPPFGAPGEATIIRPNLAGPPRRDPPPAVNKFAPPPAEPTPPQPAAPAATPYVPPRTPGNASPDEWIFTREQAARPAAQAQRPAIAIDELVAPNENPILRSAGPLLLLLGRLRVALARASFANLMEIVADSIKFFEKDIRAAGISEGQANTAKYIICATADDIVQNIPTEDRHVWTQYSMLSRFFGERIGAGRIFAS